MGFKVIDIAYGIDAYKAVVKVATLDAKIPLFLFDFNVPFGNEDRAKYIVNLSGMVTKLHIT